MGQPEFYDPLKSTVDEINTDTQSISTNVDEIKNTNLSNLSTEIGTFGDPSTAQTIFGQLQNAGVSWDKLTSRKISAYANTGFNLLPNQSVVLVNVTGKGFFNLILAYGTNCKLEIIIDDIVYDFLGVNSYIGYSNNQDVYNSQNILFNTNKDTSGNFSNVIPLNSPYFFNKNLKITITNAYTSGTSQESIYPAFDVGVF